MHPEFSVKPYPPIFAIFHASKMAGAVADQEFLDLGDMRRTQNAPE
jgi:hypothetical protein